MYIVVLLLFVYKFTDHYHRVETQLQLINMIYTNINAVFDGVFISFSVYTSQQVVENKLYNQRY